MDLDTNDQLDTHKQTLCDHIAEQKVPSKIHSNHIHQFTVQWTDEGGINEEEHAEYLETFSNDFRDAMLELIESNMKNRVKNPFGDDELGMEILEHTHNCLKRSTRIHGRDDTLQRIRQYVMDRIDQPLIIYGHPGMGKSCILSKAATLVSMARIYSL